MLYTVTFTQYYDYQVEAKTTDEAEDIAYKHFERDMLRPIARTYYDEVEVDPPYDDDEEEED